MTLLEIILLIIGAGCLVAGFFIPERPKTKASWEEKKEIKRMHDLIDSDLEKYKENLKKSLEDEMNEYMENAQKGLESISEEKIKAVTELSENAIGSINKNHDEVKDTLKAIETVKDEATADFEKSKTALDEAKDTLKAIESAKDEAKADIEKTKSELISEIEAKENEVKASSKDNEIKDSADDITDSVKTDDNVSKAEIIKSEESTIKAENTKAEESDKKTESANTVENEAKAVTEQSENINNANNTESQDDYSVVVEETVAIDVTNTEADFEEVISETFTDYTSEGEFTGVLSDDPEDDLIKILKEGMDESETGIPDESKAQTETFDSKKSKKGSKRNARRTVKRSAESISYASKNTDEILRLYKEGKSNVAIAKELGIGVGEVKLVIDLANM